MPRNPAKVWDYFQVLHEHNKRKHVVSIFCNTEYKNANATRMTEHFEKCKKCPTDVKLLCKKTTPNNFNVRSSSMLLPPISTHLLTSHTQSASEIPSTSSLANERSFSQNTTYSTEASTCHYDKDKIDAAIARAIYVSGAPLSMLDCKTWKEALQLMLPSYEPPSRYALSNVLLNAEYARVKSNSEEKIKSAVALGIAVDGWTNVNGKGVLNFMITTPDPLYYKCIVPGTEKESGRYIGEKIIEVLDEIGPTKFILLVTDNASNMKVAWREVQLKYPHIFCVGCASHSLNLIFKDIKNITNIRDTHRQANLRVNIIKKKHKLLALFRQIQESKYGKVSCSLKLSCNTRWGAVVLQLESMLKNREALEALAIAHNTDGSDIRSTLLNITFWEAIEQVTRILKPLLVAITKSEANTALLSDVPQLFKIAYEAMERELNESNLFTDQDKHVIRTAITDRRNFCLQAVHFAANLIDPRYRGLDLSAEEFTEALGAITQIANFNDLDNTKVSTNIAEFMSKTGFWTNEMMWSCVQAVEPRIWWQTYGRSQVISAIANRLLSVTPSSAACERNWSLVGSTHTKLRNRLTDDRVNKLIMIRSNLKYTDTDSFEMDMFDIETVDEKSETEDIIIDPLSI